MEPDPLPLYVEHDEPEYVEFETPRTDREILLSELAILTSADGRIVSPDILEAVIESQSTPEAIEATAAAASAGPSAATSNGKSSKVKGNVSFVPLYPEPTDDVSRAKEGIARRFLEVISKGQGDVVALFLSHNLVTANTTFDEKTPLLAAVTSRSLPLVQQLIAAGAEPDAYGVVTRAWLYGDNIITRRTPLQLAASIGHLPIVKLLMEVHHCDDSLIAPDGQIALRLAAQNGHREVVEYLPSRRGGGFLRWKTNHQKAVRRATRAVKSIYHFIKFFVWDIEKFFLWTAPKHLIVIPLSKSCKWCWAHRKEFGPWCLHQIKETPGRCKKLAKGVWKGAKVVWKGIKKVPGIVGDAAKDVWEFITKDLPKALMKLAKWLWNLLTVRFPKAIAIVARWLWSGVTATSKAIWNIITRIASFLHSVVAAVVTFFRALTLKDVWDGFCSVLHSIFVALPKTLFSWLLKLEEISWKVLKAMFGGLGECIWFLGWLIFKFFTYLPEKLWIILKSIGESLANGTHEVRVWFSPKA